MIFSRLSELFRSLLEYIVPRLNPRLEILRRFYDCNRMFNTQKKGNSISISKAQWREIKSYWFSELNIPFKWRLLFRWGGVKRWYTAYNSVCPDKQNLKYYLPEEIYYTYVDSFFSNPLAASYLDDKNYYNMYFWDVTMPKTVFRKMKGQYLDENYQKVNLDKILEITNKRKSVVCKRSVESAGGKGVRFFDFEKDTLEGFIQYVENNNELIVQDVIKQHGILSELNSSSINTIRIMTYFNGDHYVVVSSVLRMGVPGSKVDNASSGGVVCGITEDGRLREFAYDVHMNKYSVHPSGKTFKDTVVPGYKKCCDVAINLAPRLLMVSRLISWDFSVSEEGIPVLIETNMTYGQLDFHQMCNGPLFGDRLSSFLKPIIRK